MRLSRKRIEKELNAVAAAGDDAFILRKRFLSCGRPLVFLLLLRLQTL